MIYVTYSTVIIFFQEIAETLDLELFRKVMTNCYRIQIGVEQNYAREICGQEGPRQSKKFLSFFRVSVRTVRKCKLKSKCYQPIEKFGYIVAGASSRS